VCWTASLKLCIQTSEKGEMFPKALKQVNLSRLINNTQGSSSELVPYECEAIERKGPQLRSLKYIQSLWKEYPLLSTSQKFSANEGRIPGKNQC